MNPVRITFADDHPIFRRGLVELISTSARFEVVDQAGTGEQAINQMRRLKPDITILDLSMPGLGGMEVLLKSQQWASRPAIVILTLYEDAAYLRQALQYGARGYVIKDSAESEIITCLNMVSEGKHYVSPSISWQLVDDNHVGDEPLSALSPTELKIFTLVSDLRTNQEIADLLSVSIRTVQNHRAHICSKLGLRGPQALARFASQLNSQKQAKSGNV